MNVILIMFILIKLYFNSFEYYIFHVVIYYNI
jgi:hypothetical protein